MPQNEHIELFQKRYGFRLDHQERQRKKKAREHKRQSQLAQKLTGIKGKIFAKKRYSEKVQLKKTIKAHEEKRTKQKDDGKVQEGALPAYLLDLFARLTGQRVKWVYIRHNLRKVDL